MSNVSENDNLTRNLRNRDKLNKVSYVEPTEVDIEGEGNFPPTPRVGDLPSEDSQNKGDPSPCDIPSPTKDFPSPPKVDLALSTQSVNESTLLTQLAKMLHDHHDSIKSSFESNITRLEGELTAYKAQITEYEEKIKSQDAQIANLELRLVALETKSPEPNTDSDNSVNSNYARKLENMVRTQILNEAETTSCNLILSGPAVENLSPEENTTNFAIGLIKDKIDYRLENRFISSVERLGKPDESCTTEKRKIMVRLNSKFIKGNILDMNVRRLSKPSSRQGNRDFFISEQLTKDINNLYYRLRRIVSQNPGKIYTHFTRNGIIMVRRQKGEDPVRIIHEDDLVRFLKDAELPPHPKDAGSA